MLRGGGGDGGWILVWPLMSVKLSLGYPFDGSFLVTGCKIHLLRKDALEQGLHCKDHAVKVRGPFCPLRFARLSERCLGT